MAEIVPIRSGVSARNFRSIGKGSVVGSVEIEIPAWHLAITCLWISTEKGDFLSLPSQSFTNKDGKKIYKPLVEFTDKQAADRFQKAALAAAEGARKAPAQQSQRSYYGR